MRNPFQFEQSKSCIKKLVLFCMSILWGAIPWGSHSFSQDYGNSGYANSGYGNEGYTSGTANAADQNASALFPDSDPYGGADAPSAYDNAGSTEPTANDLTQVDSQTYGQPTEAGVEETPALVDEKSGLMYVNLDPIGDPNDFSGVPPVPGTMKIMADGQAPTSYMIQPGDTLFDICDQLLDEPGYWPKLWALNPDIKNPHFIWPGMILRFYPGDDLMPPFLEVQNESDLMPIDRGALSNADLVQAPLPEYEKGPVLVTDPISVLSDADLPSDSSGYTYIGFPDLPNQVNVHVPVFVFREEKEPEGVVLGGAEGGINLKSDEVGILEVENTITPGQTYSVIRYTEELENPLNGEFVGYRYQNVGTIKINELIDDGDRAIFIVLTSEFGVQSDDMVVGYMSSVRQIPTTTNLKTGPSVDASIVGFGMPHAFVGSQGNFVVLDNPGLTVGSNVGLFRALVEFGDPLGGAYIPKQLEPVGVAKVVDSTDAASVAYILYATTGVVKGDRTSEDNIIDD